MSNTTLKELPHRLTYPKDKEKYLKIKELCKLAQGKSNSVELLPIRAEIRELKKQFLTKRLTEGKKYIKWGRDLTEVRSGRVFTENGCIKSLQLAKSLADISGESYDKSGN
jgi:hypothetical protein